MKIGGRLAHCVSAWKAITTNKWIRNVIRFGYKIPLKCKPYQSRVPSNPTVSPEAHEVLLEEAEDLLKKGAIMVAQMEDSTYFSGYFAVP